MVNFTQWRSLVDGSEVNAIPDSGNLQARYDARELSLSDGSSVSTWPDETDNGNDLPMSGTVTFRDAGSSTFSGVPSVDFGGGYGQVTLNSVISPPYHVFYLGKYNVLGDFDGMWGTDGDEWKDFTVNSGSWRYDGFMEQVEIGSSDTNAHIFNHRMLDDNPSLRLDGTDVGGGALIINDESQLTFGTNPYNTSDSSDTEFVEILVYSADEESAGNESDIESYLDRDTSLL